MTERHQRRAREPRPGRADRPELRLVVDRRSPARRRCSAAPPPGPTSRARSRRPCATAAPTASTSTSSRSRRATPTSSRALVRKVRVRAERRSPGLPADVRHDRLDRQLPDRGGHGEGRRRRGRGHGLRLPLVLVERRSARSRRIGGPDYDIARHASRPTSPASRPRRSSSACRTTAAPGRRRRKACTRRTSRARSTARRRRSPYATAREFAADHGGKPTTPVEGVAWTAYRARELHDRRTAA